MIPAIRTTNEKKLVGKRLTMSFANFKMGELWGSFMPGRKAITNNLSNDLISMVIYTPTHFADFKPTNEFERWAAVEVLTSTMYHQEWKHLFCRADCMRSSTIKV